MRSPAAQITALQGLQGLSTELEKYIIPADAIELGTLLSSAGGTSKVYRGIYSTQNQTRQVAIKCIEVEPGTAIEKALQREILFYIRATQDCKQICKFYGVTEKPGQLCLVMKLYPGTLTQRIGKGLPIRDVLKYATDVAKALVELHGLGAVINDLKPDNILIDDVGDAILTDFGISRLAATNGYKPSSLQGTPHYMAPEAITYEKEEKSITVKADIWSFGCTVLHMLTGAAPWHHLPSPWTIMWKVGQDKQPPEIPAGIPGCLQQVLRGCLEPSPDKRPSAQELLQWLLVCREEVYRCSPASSPAKEQPSPSSQRLRSPGAAPASPYRRDSFGSLTGSSQRPLSDGRTFLTSSFQQQQQQQQQQQAYGNYPSIFNCDVVYGSINCSIQTSSAFQASLTGSLSMQPSLSPSKQLPVFHYSISESMHGNSFQQQASPSPSPGHHTKPPRQSSPAPIVLQHLSPAKRSQEPNHASPHADVEPEDDLCRLSTSCSDASEQHASFDLGEYGEVTTLQHSMPMHSSVAALRQNMAASMEASMLPVGRVIDSLYSSDSAIVVKALEQLNAVRTDDLAFNQRFIHALVHLLDWHQAHPPAVVGGAASVVIRLAGSEDEAEALTRAGVLHYLMVWLRNPDFDAHILLQATTAVRALCSSSDFAKRAARDSGVIDLLASLLPHPFTTVAVQAAGALKNLASDDDNKDRICQKEVIACLVTALCHSQPQVALEVTRTFSNLAAKQESRSALAQKEVIDNLEQLTLHNYIPLQDAARATLQQLSADWAQY